MKALRMMVEQPLAVPKEARWRTDLQERLRQAIEVVKKEDKWTPNCILPLLCAHWKGQIFNNWPLEWRDGALRLRLSRAQWRQIKQVDSDRLISSSWLKLLGEDLESKWSFVPDQNSVKDNNRTENNTAWLDIFFIKDTKIRMIFNAKAFNQAFEEPKKVQDMSWTILGMLLRIIRWLLEDSKVVIKVADIESAFNNFPFAFEDENGKKIYLAFQTKDGCIYRRKDERHLMYGWSFSPCVLQAFIGPILQEISDRSPQREVMYYMDDIVWKDDGSCESEIEEILYEQFGFTLPARKKQKLEHEEDKIKILGIKVARNFMEIDHVNYKRFPKTYREGLEEIAAYCYDPLGWSIHVHLKWYLQGRLSRVMNKRKHSWDDPLEKSLWLWMLDVTELISKKVAIWDFRKIPVFYVDASRKFMGWTMKDQKNIAGFKLLPVGKRALSQALCEALSNGNVDKSNILLFRGASSF